MLNFSFVNSTRIHFGAGQIQAISKEIPAKARVLLVYGGGSIKQNGIYDQLLAALTEHTVVEFSGVEPNPSYDTLMKAQTLIAEHNLDYILAVGGGSVVDGAKFIAAAACYDGEDPWDLIAKRQKLRAALSIGVVLTLPATGSESNTVSVVTRNGHKGTFSSPFVRPQFAVLDPAVTLSLSDRQIGNGVVDAFIHTIEQYLTYSVNGKVQDRFAEGLLQTLIEEGPKALATQTRNDLAVRANIMWSASLALNGLIGAGVPQDWTTHMIGHELTAAHGIDHARTLSIMLPAVLKIRRNVKRDKLLQYADRVWGFHGGDEEARIDKAIAATEAFFVTMGLPTRLADIGLGADHIDGLMDKLVEHGMVKLGEQAEITPVISRQILEAAL